MSATPGKRINVAIRRALDDISLADLQRVNSPVPQFQSGWHPDQRRKEDLDPMSTDRNELESLVNRRYEHGFVTDIDSRQSATRTGRRCRPRNLREEKGTRVHARVASQGVSSLADDAGTEWAHVHYPKIDYQAISYFSAPISDEDRPKSLDEVDPKLLETYDKLGIPLHERARLAGVAVDAVFDSVSVATTFKEKLSEAGVIFCPFSEAVTNHPELSEKISRLGRSLSRQFFCDVEFRRVQRRIVCLCAERRSLSDGAFHLLPN